MMPSNHQSAETTGCPQRSRDLRRIFTFMSTISLTECPRDAMQGWPRMIDTDTKIRYLNALLQVGFDTLDFGSFVSPKAIPQMADTADVLQGLDLSQTSTRLLAIVANVRGAMEAVRHRPIHYLGFPFSVSPTFQLRNTNSSPEESMGRVEEIQHLCRENGKELVVYISMGFGNPYGDPYNASIVESWINRLAGVGVQHLSLADTVGLATPEAVYNLVQAIMPQYPHIQMGVHLHSAPHNWQAKMDAALDAGCSRFDGALRGIGGCPMANDELVGNMDTEKMVHHLAARGFICGVDSDKLAGCSKMAGEIFV
jgi:hydroxymethylglutaryl-CoA lyase